MYSISHIYHHSRGSHLLEFHDASLWSDIRCESEVALGPADKAAGYNMLDAVER